MKLNNKAFTVIELLIAISVFTSLLLVIVFAFMYTEDTFVKSYISSNTDTIMRNLGQNISQTIALSPENGVVVLNPISASFNGTTRTIYGYCIGNLRYSYLLNTELTDPFNDVLTQDYFTGCNSSTSPLDLSNIPNGTNYKELLSANMRLGDFSIYNISSIDPGVYKLDIVIGYGSNGNLSVNLSAPNKSPITNIINFPSNTNNPPYITPQYIYQCANTKSPSGNLCDFVRYTTIINQRVL
jgi:hypothetical protein